MELLARKPGRVLWAGPDAEGRTRYEWRATTAEGVAVEPASCSYTSRHQANLAWAAENPPAPPGRPRTASEANRKAGGNPPLLLRLTPELHEATQARGGASWVRSLIEKDLKESNMITEKNIEALKNEAGEAGDVAMVEICDAALAGDAPAWSECERVISANRYED